MTEHYTAWITSAPSCTEGPYIDVTVLQDELIRYPDGSSAWLSTGDPLFHAVTSFLHDELDACLPWVRANLGALGWTPVGPEKAVPTGYTVTVERTLG